MSKALVGQLAPYSPLPPLVIPTPTPPTKVFITDIMGKPGPPGDIDPAEVEGIVVDYLEENPVTTGEVHEFPMPMGTWTITHTLNRLPSVTVFVDDEIVESDVVATETNAYVSFPTPTAGYAVLN
jgi:hypothetical protein